MSASKNMKTMAGSRLGIAVLVAVATAVVVSGVGWASIPDSGGLIHGCYKAKAAKNGTHPLAVIDAAKTATCPTGSTSLNWNANGPNGYDTQSSVTHLNDTYTQVATLTLPAGSFEINANAWLQNSSPSSSSSLGDCELVFGTATDEVEAGLLGPSSAPLDDQTLSMTVAGSVTSSSSATLSCEAIGSSGLTYAETASMTAIQVGSLSS